MSCRSFILLIRKFYFFTILKVKVALLLIYKSLHLCHITLFVLLNFSFVSSVSSAEIISDKKSGDIRVYQEQLKKIEQSILLTKEKISSTTAIEFLPDIHYMLAELMIEKANYLYIIKKESNPGVPEDQLDLTAEKRAKLDAIDAFVQLSQRYSNYKSLDKVLYIIGQESKSINENDQALRYFKKVIEQFPNSLFYSKSLMEIGSIFYEKKDYDFALEQFKKASQKSKGIDSLLIYNKMASCYTFKGLWKESLDQYFLVINFPFSAEKELIEAKEEALIQSVWPILELPSTTYTKFKRVEDLIRFYKNSSFDQNSYRKSLEKLAYRLEIKNRLIDAADVYLELFRVHKDIKSKKDSFEAFFNIRRTNLDYSYPFWIPEHLMEILIGASRPFNSKTQELDLKKYEEPFRHIIVSQHKYATKTKRKDDQLKVIKNYEYYLSTFPKSTFSVNMLKNKAELEYLGGLYFDAGSNYFEISKLPEERKNKDSKEYLISSLESALKAIEINSEDLLTKLRSRRLYKSIAKQFKTLYPRDSKVVEIDFNQGKILYDEQKLNLAAKYFIRFVKKYPTSKQAQSAVLLALDCFYLQDKPAMVSKIGRILINIKSLPKDIKSQISASVQQSQLKQVKSLAGDFSSKNYAAEFMSFAQKNKNSAMGEQALYEAFVSLKSATQEKALDVGEEYIGTYGHYPRAKDVLLQMTQLSLVLLNFSKAATYMATFSQKFPNDENAKSLLEESAQLFDSIGKSDSAYAAFQILGRPERGLASYAQWGQWSKLEEKAAQIPGLSGLYYQGLSHIRTGKGEQGIQLLKRAFEVSPNNEEEQQSWSHAGIILIETELNQFMKISKFKGFTMETLQNLIGSYQSISSISESIINNGIGLWRLAALSLNANINYYFANILEKAPAPPGIALNQFKNVIAPQVSQYRSVASQGYAACLSVGEENEIASGYVVGCRKKSFWNEAKEQFKMRASRSLASDSVINKQLIQNPRSSELIQKLAAKQISINNEAMALASLTRAKELAPNSASVESLRALALLRLGGQNLSMLATNEALKLDPQDPLALAIKMSLLKKFGYTKKLSQLNKNNFNTKSPYIHLIPN